MTGRVPKKVDEQKPLRRLFLTPKPKKRKPLKKLGPKPRKQI